MIYIVEDNIIENISNIFNNHFDYDYLYISIGSKMNEKRVSIGNKIYMSNAFDQIYPGFLQSNEINKILFIAIDDFRNKEKQTIHKNQINALISPTTKCYLLNQLCNEKFLISFLDIVLNKLSSIDFKPKNFMIANYVRYLHIPNKREEASEIMIPIVIQNILENEKYINYSNCFYQWFGYKKYFYNYIYNYKNFKQNPTIYNKMYFIEEILRNSQNIPCAKNIVLQDNSIIHILENIYNISNPNVVSIDMTVSVYEDYKAMGLIIPI